MNKKDVLEMHRNMEKIFRWIQSKDELTVPHSYIEQYDNLADPDQSHLSKESHVESIFVLGELLMETLSEEEFDDSGRLARRMEEIIEERDF